LESVVVYGLACLLRGAALVLEGGLGGGALSFEGGMQRLEPLSFVGKAQLLGRLRVCQLGHPRLRGARGRE
jgi:hypothetical protein